jgi:hypothetical protein
MGRRSERDGDAIGNEARVSAAAVAMRGGRELRPEP